MLLLMMMGAMGSGLVVGAQAVPCVGFRAYELQDI